MTQSETPTLASLDTTHAGRSESAATVLPTGTTIGRYVVLGAIGKGGMGAVYGAYDPELDRKVALKLLHSAQDERRSDVKRARLIREAKALAKLVHPNVVTIYDVGVHEQRVWLAMELVDGVTLGTWLHATRRSVREILEILIALGRGVAAAHAAGLVHRDLKPENVMIAARPEDPAASRVRVMDFGLALEHGEASDSDAGTSSSASRDDRLTQAGALVGTPAYMAPEQLIGGAIGPATDQFSFCVLAWEALHGCRPYEASGAPALAAAILRGTVNPVPRDVATPAWLRRVLLRGLAAAPNERWPDLPTLLDALVRGCDRAPRRRIAIGLAAIAVVIAGGIGVQQLRHRRALAACDRQSEVIDEVWSAAARERLATVLRGSGVAHAAVTADKAIPWLDARAQAWRDTATRVCVAADVDHTLDAALHERAGWCLDESRIELAATVSRLSAAEPGEIHRAVAMAARPTTTSRCDEVDVLARMPAPPVESRAQIIEVRTAIADALLLGLAGRYANALVVAEDAHARAVAIDWPPLLAMAHYRRATVLDRLERIDEARTGYVDAYFAAAGSGAGDLAVSAAAELVYLEGVTVGNFVQAGLWARTAELELQRVGGGHPLTRAMLLGNRASLSGTQQQLDVAESDRLAQLALVEPEVGPSHPLVAECLGGLGNTQRKAGRLEEARTNLTRSLEIFEDAYGTDHPDVANALNLLGTLEADAGNFDAAVLLLRRSLAIREAVNGPESVAAGHVLGNIASLERRRGRLDAALPLSIRARDVLLAKLGKHPDVAFAHVGLGGVLVDLERFDEAVAELERGVEIFEKVVPDHPLRGDATERLAAAKRALAERGAARTGSTK